MDKMKEDGCPALPCDVLCCLAGVGCDEHACLYTQRQRLFSIFEEHDGNLKEGPRGWGGEVDAAKRRVGTSHSFFLLDVASEL